MKNLAFLILIICLTACGSPATERLTLANDSLTTRLAQELEFIGQQQKQLDFLKAEHEKEIRLLEEEMEGIKDQTELGRMLKIQEELNSAQMKATLKQIQKDQQKIKDLEKSLQDCESK